MYKHNKPYALNIFYTYTCMYIVTQYYVITCCTKSVFFIFIFLLYCCVSKWKICIPFLVLYIDVIHTHAYNKHIGKCILIHNTYVPIQHYTSRKYLCVIYCALFITACTMYSTPDNVTVEITTNTEGFSLSFPSKYNFFCNILTGVWQVKLKLKMISFSIPIYFMLKLAFWY